MKYASSLLMLIFCTTTVFGNEQDGDFEQALKQVKEAAPVFFNWSIAQINDYPFIPGILTAGLLRSAKEAITSKRASFVVWAALGVVLAEPYAKFAKNYIQSKETQRYEKRRNVDWSEEIHKAGEDAKATGKSVATAVKNDLLGKVSDKIDDIIGNNNKK